MELTRVTKTSLDITAETEVLSYTYSGDDPIEIMASVALGSESQPISGVGGAYALRVYINDVLVTPESAVTVPASQDRTKMVSRAVPIDAGDVVVLTVSGLSGDLAITTVAALRDVTPLRGEELQGSGAVIVDHDYGGVDALRVLNSAGASVENAQIVAYLESDYNNGNRSKDFVRGRTTTDVNGRWREPLALDPEDYVLIINKPNAYSAKVVSITVA